MKLRSPKRMDDLASFKKTNLVRLGSFAYGVASEARILRFLEKDPELKILAQNYRAPRGEIDFIFMEAHELVFLEVKARLDGDPLDAVDGQKQSRIKLAAEFFIETSPLPQIKKATSIRFDVALLRGEDLEYIRDVF